MFGALMGVSGVWLMNRYPRWYTCAAAVVLMACSIGVYQANMAVFISVLLLAFIRKVADEPDFSFLRFLGQAVLRLGVCVLALELYLRINDFFLARYEIMLTNYQGINTYGITDLSGYLDRIGDIYSEFFVPNREAFRNMYPFAMRTYYMVWIGTGAILSLRLAVRTAKEKPEVAAMPCYPDSGSLKVIDGTLVVKLSQPETAEE